MNTRADGKAIALSNEVAMLRGLHRFGWLRTRDLALLVWRPRSRRPSIDGPTLVPMDATASELRMAQRTLARLRKKRLILTTDAPNGSRIHALAEGGARALQSLGVEADTGKDLMRHYSSAFFRHRVIANEVAISGLLEGLRVTTERETATGRWIGGMKGFEGKKPDVLLRAGDRCWWLEVEHSRKNQKDYEALLKWLTKVWRSTTSLGEPPKLGDGTQLVRVIFVCTAAFGAKLTADLEARSWTKGEIDSRLAFEQSLYSMKDISFY